MSVVKRNTIRRTPRTDRDLLITFLSMPPAMARLFPYSSHPRSSIEHTFSPVARGWPWSEWVRPRGETASMCGRLAELRQAMAAYAAGFDAGLLTGDDAARARDHAAAIEHVAATLKAVAAARVAKGPGGGTAAGARPPTSWPRPPGRA